MIKIWLDDERKAPSGFIHLHSVNEVIDFILTSGYASFYLDLDHDLGVYNTDGGDAIKLINWLLQNGYHDNTFYKFRFHLHTANSVGYANMKSDIIRYFGQNALDI